MEDLMSRLYRIFLLVVVVGLVFSFGSLYADDTKKEDKAKPEFKTKTVYECPMKKCEVQQEKAGKCPKCGMDLKKKEYAVVYYCPMKKCRYHTNKPGKCTKCGMALKEKLTDKAHLEKHDHKHDHKHEHKDDKKHDHKHDHKDDHKH